MQDVNGTLNIGLAFFEGLALIISPCILPILPIILSGSLTGSKKRPFGIIIGFIVTFTIFTLFTRFLVQLIHINYGTIRFLSFLLLLFMGIILLIPSFTEKFNIMTQRLTNVGSTQVEIVNPESGFWHGLLFGALVGIIWTPCAGPILAAVILQVVLQKITLTGVLIVVAFAIGAALPMFLIALLGRGLMQYLKVFQRHAILFRQFLGAVIIGSVFFLMFDVNATFFSPVVTQTHLDGHHLVDGLASPYPAPKIEGIDAWINSPPLTLAALKGKVVLIDFWTYSCINCIRTLPYLKAWYKRYRQYGFVIIGVHSPEFEFEHNLQNVQNAVKRFGITYPVALDNHFITWQNYHNAFWPAHYLINKEGEVVYQHFGEGEYAETENNIRFLLGIRGTQPITPIEKSMVGSYRQTPETYLGYARMENYVGSPAINPDSVTEYTFPSALQVNQWALSGKWIVKEEKIVAAAPNAAIKLRFRAAKVYAVMGTQTVNALVKVTYQNAEKLITVKRNQLYTLLDQSRETEGTLVLESLSAGLEVYTFTFGG